MLSEVIYGPVSGLLYFFGLLEWAALHSSGLLSSQRRHSLIAVQ